MQIKSDLPHEGILLLGMAEMSDFAFVCLVKAVTLLNRCYCNVTALKAHPPTKSDG